MTIIAHIVRIERDWIRVPLCYVWYPIQIADMVLTAFLDGESKRIFTRRFWAFTLTAFWVGHDGVLVGVPREPNKK